MSNPIRINGDLYQKVKTTSEGAQNRLFVQKFDTVGDGSGSWNMNVDGSGTVKKFRIIGQANKEIYISRLIFLLTDGGVMDSGGWGNNGGSPLPNGLLYRTFINNITKDFDYQIKSHYDLASLAYDVDRSGFGSGDEWVACRLTFTKMGAYVRLLENEYIEIEIRDDLTYLTSQSITAEGFINEIS